MRSALNIASAVAFFLPRIAAHVVAASFPIASLIGLTELYAGDPFRALPGVQPRDDQPGRPPMLFCDRLAVMRQGDQCVLG